MWKRRRQEIHGRASISARKLDGMPYSKTNTVSKPTEETAVRISERLAYIDRQISRHIEAIETATAEAEVFILTIDDSMMRQILEYRCCKLWSWKTIARHLGDGYTPEAVRQTYHRFILTLPPG